MTEKHLWEIDHPYYCNEGNYFDNDCFEQYKSWEDFLNTEGNADFDMNLVFRWDWRLSDPDEKKHGNKNEELLIFWMGQRKGLYRYTRTIVKSENEPAIREWLTKRYEHLKLLWEPL